MARNEPFVNRKWHGEVKVRNGLKKLQTEKFHTFFHNCRVEGVPEQNSRLLLCETVAQVLARGIDILGLKPLEKM